ncbi:MAG: Y-family DNA polymerase [Bacteroidales bacterium]
MYALLDCNNFFVSCERVFNPALNNKPVIVLSGNDGCVIARSNEAKQLGIKMGVPAFQIRELIQRHGVIIYSGNHELYRDMSHRVMSTLSELIDDDIQIYSVDEAFFTLDTTAILNPTEYLKELTAKITKYVGIPVSIGAGETKTLAKIASHIAKREYNNRGNSYILENPTDIETRLKSLPTNEVWGLGRKTSDSLARYNIYSAYEFTQLPRKQVRSLWNVTAERTWLELHGEDCSDTHGVKDIRKSISVSRTFGSIIYDIETLSEAVVTFASQAAVKLRGQHSVTSSITVYIRGNIHNQSLDFYSNSTFATIPTPTASTLEIVRYATSLLKSIYRKGYAYKKAGIILTEIVDESSIQLSLFNPIDEGKHKRLMQAIDRINSSASSSKIKLLSEGLNKHWQPKELHKSQAFSTKLNEIITINCTEKGEKTKNKSLPL